MNLHDKFTVAIKQPWTLLEGSKGEKIPDKY
jgi:hypothetical protein